MIGIKRLNKIILLRSTLNTLIKKGHVYNWVNIYFVIFDRVK